MFLTSLLAFLLLSGPKAVEREAGGVETTPAARFGSLTRPLSQEAPVIVPGEKHPRPYWHWDMDNDELRSMKSGNDAW